MKRISIIISFLLIFAAVPLFSHGLDVSAVQWEMDMRYITDQNLFWDDVEAVLDTEEAGTLVIFPEYTSVFLALDTFGPIIAKHDQFLGAWFEVAEQFGYRSIQELFVKQSLHIQSKVQQWARLARQSGCYIIPGTFFTYDPGSRDLVNRMIVIDPLGDIIYSQDKVYCTPFETDYCGISGQRVSDASSFTINDVEIAVTICRDTFFESWEKQFGAVDLWVDIKANGAAYDEVEQDRFTRAVPERVAGSGSRYGLTLCLTGELFDLFWEGESSVVDADENKLISSGCVDAFDRFSFQVAP